MDQIAATFICCGLLLVSECLDNISNNNYHKYLILLCIEYLVMFHCALTIYGYVSL